MSVALVQADPSVVLTRAHAALDELHGLDLTALSADDLLAYWRELERLRRRLPALDHALVLEAEGRGLPQEHHVRSTSQFLRGCCASIRVRRPDGSAPRTPPVDDGR